MEQVKIFRRTYAQELEEEINKWLHRICRDCDVVGRFMVYDGDMIIVTIFYKEKI